MKVKKDYNKELVKRGELLIDPSFSKKNKSKRKTRKEADHTSIPETSSSF